MTLSETALSRLVTQYRQRPNLRALVRALAREYDNLEATFADLKTRLSIDESRGVQLDGIGEIVGQPRPFVAVGEDTTFAFQGPGAGLGFSSIESPDDGGRFVGLETDFEIEEPISDSDYRRVLRAAVRSNYSASSADDILGFLSQSLGLRARLVTQPGAITLRFTRELLGFENRIIQDSLPVAAGVRYEIGDLIVVLAARAAEIRIRGDTPIVAAGMAIEAAANAVALVSPRPSLRAGVGAVSGAQEVGITSDAPSLTAGAIMEPDAAEIGILADRPATMDSVRLIAAASAVAVFSPNPGAAIGHSLFSPGNELPIAQDPAAVSMGLSLQSGQSLLAIASDSVSVRHGQGLQAGISEVDVQSDAPDSHIGVSLESDAAVMSIESEAPSTAFGLSLSAAENEVVIASDASAASLGASLTADASSVAIESAAARFLISAATLWHSDMNNTTIYELDPADMSVLRSNAPGGNIRGCGGSADRLYTTDASTDEVQRRDPADFSLLVAEPGPGGNNAQDIGGNDLAVYAANNANNTLYRLSTDLTTILQSTNPPGDANNGAGGDDVVAYTCSGTGGTDGQFKLDASDLSVILAATRVGNAQRGTGGDQYRFWMADSGDDVIREIDVDDMETVLLSVGAPGTGTHGVGGSSTIFE